MERIAVILALFVLLMNGRHVEHRRMAGIVPITVVATPMPLNAGDPGQRWLGPLRYLGGWVLTSSTPGFGGISSMHFAPDGQLVTLNDTGEVAVFRPGDGARAGRMWALPAFDWEKNEPRWRWDTESMTVDPASGRTWVGFELTQRICRYGPGLVQVEGCVHPPATQRWPATTGMESLQRLPDGRFLAIAEDAAGAAGGKDVVLFAGDPVVGASPAGVAAQDGARGVHLGYRAPEGYLPTDALWLGNGRMLVLNRRVTLFDGFTALLALVDVGDPHAGEILEGRVVAQLAAPIQHDNYEALALSFERGRPILWIASDDNHFFFQRSLLLKFALPQAWLAPRIG